MAHTLKKTGVTKMDNILQCINQSKQLREKNDYQNALLLINKCIDKNSNSSELFIEKSSIYYIMKDDLQTVKCLNIAIKLSLKPMMSLYFRKAEIELSLGLYKESISDFTKVIHSNNKFYIDSAYNFRAMAYVYTNQYQEALEDLDLISNDQDMGLLLKKKDNNYLTKEELLQRINNNHNSQQF